MIFRRVLGNIRLFTRRYGLITVVTDIYREGRRDLGGVMRDVCDRHVRLTDTKDGVSVYDVNAGIRKEYRDVGRNQMVLGDFSAYFRKYRPRLVQFREVA